MSPLWDLDWTRFSEGTILAYQTAPFESSTVVAGPGYADLWVRSPVDDLGVQVTLTEVRPDGDEYLIQSGWLRLGHRAATVSDDRRLSRTYSEEQFESVPVDTFISARVSIPSVAHPVRAGSSLRMLISTPGRDHGTWEFEAPNYGEPPLFALGYGEATPTALTMSILPGIEIPAEYPPCPALRGQPCRAVEPIQNIPWME